MSEEHGKGFSLLLIICSSRHIADVTNSIEFMLQSNSIELKEITWGSAEVTNNEFTLYSCSRRPAEVIDYLAKDDRMIEVVCCDINLQDEPGQPQEGHITECVMQIDDQGQRERREFRKKFLRVINTNQS